MGAAGNIENREAILLLSVRLELCDTMSQSQEGELMAFMIIKAAGREHIRPPVRAEPVLGRKQPVCTV